MPDQKINSKEGKNVYILITQCLQNGFFLDNESRLALPMTEVNRLLVGSQSKKETDEGVPEQTGTIREIAPDSLKQGPLYQFFEQLTSDLKNGTDGSQEFHIIHLKDWHKQGAGYDRERELYGVHCQADTWAAQGIDGLEIFLEPWGTNAEYRQQAQKPEKGFAQGKVVFHEVLSDSLFDFRPSYDRHSHNHCDERSDFDLILKNILDTEDCHTYVAVIGVYTDIKIKLLLTQLRAFYQIDNLIVSDVLTAAPTLERHLSGLDFAQKVLGVEVVHSLNDLLRILRPNLASPPAIPPEIYKTSINFRDYQNYYWEKQNLLGYQEGKLLEYVDLTKRRATHVYRQTQENMKVLNNFGIFFLGFTAFSALAAILCPKTEIVAITGILGGMSVIQMITTFFWNPIDRLQKNLNEVVRLQTNLESYSLALALTRYHISTPEWLHHTNNKAEADEIAQVESVKKQVEIIHEIASKVTALLKEEFALPEDPANPTP